MGGSAFAAAGLLAAIGAATLAAGGAFAPPQGRDVRRFSHKHHVPEVWFDLGTKEVWRDCRGCHRFGAANPVSAPQQHCDQCHFPTLQDRQATAGWERDLSNYTTRTREAFRHHTHAMLECRECHLPEKTEFLVDFDIVTGPGQCVRCHEEGAAEAAAPVGRDPTPVPFALFRTWRLFEPATDPATAAPLGLEPFVPPQPGDYARYARTLATVFAGPTGGLNTTPLGVGGAFDHYDHGDIACSDCHRNIPTASAFEVGTGQIPADGCAKCHVKDEQRTAAAPATAPKKVVRPLWSLGAFVHSDHYRFLSGEPRRGETVATPAAYEQLERAGERACQVCHRQDPAAIGLPARDFPFEPGKSESTYADCARCHAVPGWTTGETREAPLHDSSDGRVGAGNGWGECERCHTFGAGDFAGERPRVEVTRTSGRQFEFALMTHPDITVKGVAASGRAALQQCSECHRARVPELPSRLQRRAFRHASHLPADPSPADCAKCHDRVERSATAQTLAGDDRRTYSLAGCTSCHLGSAVVEVDADDVPPVAREVVRFPHAPHVGKASCTQCHELAGDGADVLTKASASACTECHDHRRATEGPLTERVFDGEVESCARCHHEDRDGAAALLSLPPIRGSGADANDRRYNAEQTTFAGFADSQYHPLGGKCDQCHEALPDEPDRPRNMRGLVRKREDHLKAAKVSPHRLANQAGKQPATCLGCHWTPLRGLEAGAGGTPQEKFFRTNPADAATRKQYGNDANGYPGDKARG